MVLNGGHAIRAYIDDWPNFKNWVESRYPIMARDTNRQTYSFILFAVALST